MHLYTILTKLPKEHHMLSKKTYCKSFKRAHSNWVQAWMGTPYQVMTTWDCNVVAILRSIWDLEVADGIKLWSYPAGYSEIGGASTWVTKIFRPQVASIRGIWFNVGATSNSHCKRAWQVPHTTTTVIRCSPRQLWRVLNQSRQPILIKCGLQLEFRSVPLLNSDWQIKQLLFRFGSAHIEFTHPWAITPPP